MFFLCVFNCCFLSLSATPTEDTSYTLSLIRKSLRSVHMSQAEIFEETIPHLFVIFGASVIIIIILEIVFSVGMIIYELADDYSETKS